MRLAFILAALLGSASAQTLIVGNKAEHTVSFVDLESGEEVVRRETGRFPHEIVVSPDGEQVVVVSYRGPGFDGDELYRFDARTAEPLGPVSLDGSKGPHGLKWIPNTDHVIVTTEITEDVVIIDPQRGRIRDRVKTDQQGSHMVAVSPDGLRAYVANIGSGTFTVIDIPAAKKLRDVKAGEQTEAIAISPSGQEIFVGNNGSKSVMIFDAETLELRDTVETEGIPIRIEISPDGTLFAVSQPDRGNVVIYQVGDLQPAATVELGEGTVPVTLLFSPEGDVLWAAATGAEKVFEIDMESFDILHSFDVGQGSDGLGYAPGDVTPSE
ncbi:YncE family protein [Parvularcula lutaonensis]|uniref:YncE family protein n=1 Tax=Parvularcula lutaonensis TaxID=491923 RepID=A0ABV7MA47_9PROT|nr:YncE family protein [Parvularcula lutaonensis]GGY36677.1 hypothetical protein GCM10007148_01070 [Parvularcula lutaonensis]